MPFLFLAFLTGLCCLIVLVAVIKLSEYRDEEKELIESEFCRDLERTKQSMKFCNLNQADALIDLFEEKWKGRVDINYLYQGIGRLIEEQFTHEKQKS